MQSEYGILGNCFVHIFPSPSPPLPHPLDSCRSALLPLFVPVGFVPVGGLRVSLSKTPRFSLSKMSRDFIVIGGKKGIVCEM